MDERIQSAHNLNHVFSNNNSEIVKKNYKINNTDILIYRVVYKTNKKQQYVIKEMFKLIITHEQRSIFIQVLDRFI